MSVSAAAASGLPLFGGPTTTTSTPTSNLFGTPTQLSTPAATNASTTATVAQGGGFSFLSKTSAPSTTAGVGLFGSGNATPKTEAVAGLATTATATTAAPTTAATTGVLGFGMQQPAGIAPFGTAAAGGSLATGASLFNAQKTEQANKSLFSGLGTTTTTAQPAAATTTAAGMFQAPATTIAPTPATAPSLFPSGTATAALPAKTTAAGGFQFAAATTATSLSSPSTTTTATAMPQPPSSLVQTPTSARKHALGPGATTTAAPAAASSGFSLGLTAASTAAAPPTTATTTTTAAEIAAIDTSKPLTFAQLEQMINRWTYDVEEQEKVFLHQATEVNAWDRILRENGAKIVGLCEDVNVVEDQLERANHDLDFVETQQKELDELIGQMESQLNVGQWLSGEASAYLSPNHSDIQREAIANLHVTVDGQVKQLGRDVTNLSERVSSLRGVTDEGDENEEPSQQVARILQRQMQTLQWVDEQTDSMGSKLAQLKAEILRRRRLDSSRVIHLD